MKVLDAIHAALKEELSSAELRLDDAGRARREAEAAHAQALRMFCVFKNARDRAERDSAPEPGPAQEAE